MDRLIFEAVYDTMVASMKNKFTLQKSEIDAKLQWIKQYIKKSDGIIWFLRVYNAILLYQNATSLGRTKEDVERKELKQVLGDTFRAKSITDVQNELEHFFGFQAAEIQNYQYEKKTVSQVLSDFMQVERAWIERNRNNREIQPQQGDREIITFSDGSAWWFVDRAYCPDEGRSGGHCGNIVGQSQKDQRILSYRRDNKVYLTFILLPDGFLGEMKARFNQKPTEDYHRVILALLFNDIIKGIRGAGYLPEANFSLFDLHEQYLKQVWTKKPILIMTQLSVSPGEVLSAPRWLLRQPAIRQHLEKDSKRVADLITPMGDITRDPALWETAIYENPEMILFADNIVPRFTARVIGYLTKNPEKILAAPIQIRTDFKMLSAVINGYSAQYGDQEPPIAFIMPSTPNYEELVILACTKDPEDILYIDEEHRTKRVILAVLHNSTANMQFGYLNHRLIPPNKFTTAEMKQFFMINPELTLKEVPIEVLNNYPIMRAALLSKVHTSRFWDFLQMNIAHYKMNPDYYLRLINQTALKTGGILPSLHRSNIIRLSEPDNVNSDILDDYLILGTKFGKSEGKPNFREDIEQLPAYKISEFYIKMGLFYRYVNSKNHKFIDILVEILMDHGMEDIALDYHSRLRYMNDKILAQERKKYDDVFSDILERVRRDEYTNDGEVEDIKKLSGL